jgi:SAM-dependent methyltransferase
MTPRLLCPQCRGSLTAQADGARCDACSRVYPERDGVLELVAGRGGAPSYDPHYYDSLARIEEEHFWFVARRELILESLRRHVPDLTERPLFDLGCGSGGLLSFLQRSGVPVAGACDAYPESLRLVRQRVAAPLYLVDEGRLPPFGPSLRLVSLFDVLEHITDDLGTLSWVHSALEPGGVVILTVPAHPFLFDELDEIAHHRRRYRRSELRDRIEGAGLRVRFISHFMAPLVPALVLWRWFGRMALGGRDPSERRAMEFRINPWLNRPLTSLLRLEGAFLRRSTLPVGSSILAIAARPGTGPGA